VQRDERLGAWHPRETEASREGDIISIDCGAVVNGFVGDAAFTAGIGQISPLASRLIEVTRQALFVGIAMMRPGTRRGDVSAAIQQFVEAQGYQVTREYTGHGVGRKARRTTGAELWHPPGTGVLLTTRYDHWTLEPMVLVGTYRTLCLSNQWTVVC